MDKVDIPFLSVTELSRLMERKVVSPVEATEAYLDFKFNAYLTVCRNEALQAAREAEQAIVQGNYLGPMHGVPVRRLSHCRYHSGFRLPEREGNVRV